MSRQILSEFERSIVPGTWNCATEPRCWLIWIVSFLYLKVILGFSFVQVNDAENLKRKNKLSLAEESRFL